MTAGLKGKTLAISEIQYIIVGVDHLPPPPIFEMINYNKFVETLREDFFK